MQSATLLHGNDGLDLAVKDGRVVGMRGRAGSRQPRPPRAEGLYG
ncbi:hypothetical protein [Nonomuraea sp. NPDC049625]